MKDAGESESPRIVTHGRAEIGFALRDGVTRLKHLYQHEPLRVLFPGVPAGDVPVAALVTTSGGLVGGDRIEIAATVAAGARARIAPQAAEKIYRSLGPPVVVDIAFDVGPGAWLEYLPLETILFDGARLDRICRLNLAGDARAMAGEILVFGRQARGEVMTTGAVRDALSVRRDGRLIWADAFDPRGDLGPLDHPAGLGGARALATLIYAGDDAAALVDPVRDLQAEFPVPDGQAGTSAIGPVLVARWIGRDVLAMRRAYANVWQQLRVRAAGLPPVLPRHWHV
ncbi:MAG: urease accessory protein UreD [Proteobacteria bacterium]|nr:urease accessory protein UreD [Pseudomonadota bacterium]